jgi:predicted RNA-binding protein
MCEFKVILDGKEVFKDVISAKTEKNGVIVRNVMGQSE